ncbi:MAG: DoxX family protein [Myxococcota bacterium]
MKPLLNHDVSELLFRLLFSSIFVVLGTEHLFSDGLIQQLMPAWVPMPRIASIASGVILLVGGASIALGVRVQEGAILLGVFLVVVTLVIHVPGMFQAPAFVAPDNMWLWDLYQRSNFIKNVCLLGVCFHLLTHEPGAFTLPAYLARRDH